MRKVQKGFTLVELIVVITILAILGTIAFISLQGYSQDAKNSKVNSDVRSLISAIETAGSTSGKSVPDFITAAATNEIDGTTTIAYIDGTTKTATQASADAFGTGYIAGTIDFIALGQNGEEFKDSDNNGYLIASAATGATSYYQVAGQTKNSGGNFEAVVKGTYLKNTNTTATADGLIAPAQSTTSLDDGVIDSENLGTNGLY